MALKYPAMTMNRKSLTGRTLWCGPFAIAVITGLDYDTAYAKLLSDIRRTRMKSLKRRYKGLSAYRLREMLPKVIKGTYEHQIEGLLNKLKVKTKLVYFGGMRYRPTLITFAREHTRRGRTYILVAGHHWLTMQDGIIYHSHHAPKPVEEMAKYRMAKVECYAEVEPLPAALAEPAALSEAA